VIASGGNGSTVAVANLTAVHLGGDVYIIRGKTSPGVNVRVSGRETPALSDGTFQIQITAPATVREVNVQAADSQGNTSSYRVTLTRTS